jgi:preprotein translocase subunit SecY
MALNQLGGAGVGDGVALLVAAGIVAEIVAKACSSPQTTELNADKRAPTLMKWVNIGMAEAAVFIVIAAALDRRHRRAIIIGGTLEGVITYAEYLHGKKAGLASNAPGTEDTGGAAPARAAGGASWGWR